MSIIYGVSHSTATIFHTVTASKLPARTHFYQHGLTVIPACITAYVISDRLLRWYSYIIHRVFGRKHGGEGICIFVWFVHSPMFMQPKEQYKCYGKRCGWHSRCLLIRRTCSELFPILMPQSIGTRRFCHRLTKGCHTDYRFLNFPSGLTVTL